MEGGISMTINELSRSKIIQKVAEKGFTQSKAVNILNVSKR